MKKSAIACLLMIVIVFSFGCKKDDSSTPAAGMSVKIDGTAWSGKINAAIYNTLQNVTMITSSNTSPAEQLQLGFQGQSTGTFNFSADDMFSYGAFANLSNGDMYASISSAIPVGQIVVTEYDVTNHTISGTFHFEAYNFDDQKKVFTEGKFTKIKFEDQ
jgi:hypothetical protein